ncbi:MAG TPA: hypothetical protein VIJ00_01350 [Nakamurella sp.]
MIAEPMRVPPEASGARAIALAMASSRRPRPSTLFTGWSWVANTYPWARAPSTAPCNTSRYTRE